MSKVASRFDMIVRHPAPVVLTRFYFDVDGSTWDITSDTILASEPVSGRPFDFNSINVK